MKEYMILDPKGQAALVKIVSAFDKDAILYHYSTARSIFANVVKVLSHLNIKKAYGTDHVYCIWWDYKKNAWFKNKVYPNGLIAITTSSYSALKGRRVVFCCLTREPKRADILKCAMAFCGK